MHMCMLILAFGRYQINNMHRNSAECHSSRFSSQLATIGLTAQSPVRRLMPHFTYFLIGMFPEHQTFHSRSLHLSFPSARELFFFFLRIASRAQPSENSYPDLSKKLNLDAARKMSGDRPKSRHGVTENALELSTVDDDSGVFRTILQNPVIVLCALYGNIGALMYGFDNITLSLCLDMQAFV